MTARRPLLARIPDLVAVLRAAAEAGRVCPSNREISEMMGMDGKGGHTTLILRGAIAAGQVVVEVMSPVRRVARAADLSWCTARPRRWQPDQAQLHAAVPLPMPLPLPPLPSVEAAQDRADTFADPWQALAEAVLATAVRVVTTRDPAATNDIHDPQEDRRRCARFLISMEPEIAERRRIWAELAGWDPDRVRQRMLALLDRGASAPRASSGGALAAPEGQAGWPVMDVSSRSNCAAPGHAPGAAAFSGASA